MNESRVLLDIRGLVLQSWHAGNDKDPVRDPETGETFNSAAHGVSNFLRYHLFPVLENYAPHQIVAVHEGSNERRRALFANYKAKRKAKEQSPVAKEQQDLAMKYIKQILAYLGAIQVKVPHAEADDAIAWIAKRAKGGKLIHTVDGDLVQLVADDCVVAVSGEYYSVGMGYKDSSMAEACPTHLMSLRKSIVGDSSDEYGGVKGLGPKAWDELVEVFGYDGMEQLEQCVATRDYSLIEQALAETANMKLQKLYDSRGEWQTMYLLASLHPEWCEGVYFSKIIKPEWYKRVPDAQRVVDLLGELHLDSEIEQIQPYLAGKVMMDAESFDESDYEVFAEEAKKGPCVAFDYESFDTLKWEPYQQAKKGGGYVDMLHQKITGMSMTFGRNLEHTFYIPVCHRDSANLTIDHIVEFLSRAPEDVPLVAHNAMFEATVSEVNFEAYPDKLYDTAIMASYVDENESASLKHQSKHWMNYNQTTYQEVLDAYGAEDMADLTAEQVFDYGCDDSIVAAHLFVLHKLIMELEGTWDFCEQNEFDFMYPMKDSFIAGWEIDWEHLRELEQKDAERLAIVQKGTRELLAEHCAKVNEEGVAFLKEEILPFEEAVLKEKGKSADEIKKKLAEKEAALREACKYTPRQPDPALLNAPPEKKWGKVATLLALPGLRAKKHDKVKEWAEKMAKQAADKGVRLTDDQRQFLEFIQGYCDDVLGGEPEPSTKLNELLNKVITKEQSLWVGDELNPGSPKQMIELFYGKMGLPLMHRGDVEKGSTREKLNFPGAPSTNEGAIAAWAAEIPDENDWRRKVLSLVLEERAISTRQSLFYTPWTLFKSPDDGRIHPQIKNCGTSSRRPSGTSPNALQVPKTKDGGEIRRCVLPHSDNELIVSIDWSQQELRILAALSQDPNLLACYVGDEDKDVHVMTTAAILKKAFEETQALYDAGDEEVSLVRKKKAKTTNFLMVYKGSPQGLAKKALIPLTEAEAIVSAFYRQYPGVEKYQASTIAFAEQHGYVTGLYGTRKHCWDILSDDRSVAAAVGRSAVNYRIQGGAAEVLKMVVREMRQRELLERCEGRLLAPVYDELTSSINIDHIITYIREMQELMTIQIPGTDIVLKADISLGPNWGDQIELGFTPTDEEIQAAIEKSIEMRNERYSAEAA